MHGLQDIKAKNAYATACHKAQVEADATGETHYVIKIDGQLYVTPSKPDHDYAIKYTALPKQAA